MSLWFYCSILTTTLAMTTNDAQCSVMVEHLAPGQTSTTDVEVGVPLSFGYDERGRVV